MLSINIRALPRKEYLCRGNAACPGCPETLGLRYVGMALGDKAVLVVPAGCSSVIQGMGPKNGFAIPTLNIVFAAAAATASGLARALRRRGVDAQVVVWAGDGGTADIGLQALSGAAERGENKTVMLVADFWDSSPHARLVMAEAYAEEAGVRASAHKSNGSIKGYIV
ncbi:MAG TPA: hypothetical protein EYP08_06080, partial [Pyrodictiaceae archaeon]|nr:hypothetical protein [Pyrodictiaceae archaeon]